jgi:hypothetical protein
MIRVYYASERLSQPAAKVLETLNKKSRHSALLFQLPGGELYLFELIRLPGKGLGKNGFRLSPVDANAKVGTDESGSFVSERTVAEIGFMDKSKLQVINGVNGWASTWVSGHIKYKPFSENCRCLVDSTIQYLWGAFNLKFFGVLGEIEKKVSEKPIDSIEAMIVSGELPTVVGKIALEVPAEEYGSTSSNCICM